MSRESRVSEHFTVQHSAIKMLSSRLAIIRDYVRAVESGNGGSSNVVLTIATINSRIHQFCHSLTICENLKFELLNIGIRF